MIHTPVSVIIPTYNRAERLPASINSVLGQTFQDVEVIVVDDGSTDDTERVVSSIKDERLRYHRLMKNGGAANARNVGVGLAKNEIIAFNDSDDLWHPQKLDKQLIYWEEHPEHILVYCAYKVDLPNDEILRVPSLTERPEDLQGDIFYLLLLRPTIGTPTMITTKKAFFEAGGFNASYPACEDWEFTVRLSRLGSIGFVDEILLTVEATASDRLSASVADYYQARCMMLADYLDYINAIGQFDTYAKSILDSAETKGFTEQAKQLMLHYLAQKKNLYS